MITIMKKLTIAALALCMITTMNACSGGGSNSPKETESGTGKIEPATIVVYNEGPMTEESFNELYGNSLREKLP